jgi:hypothetical protein
MKLSIVSTSISFSTTLILVSMTHYVKEILDPFTAPKRYGDRSVVVPGKTVVKAFAFLLLRLSRRDAIVVALVAISCYSSCSCSE